MKNVLEKISKGIKENIDIFLFGIFLFICDIYIKVNCEMGLSKVSFFFNLFYISILLILISFLKKRIRSIIEIIISSCISFYSFAQVIHYNFFTTLYRFKKLKVINELGDVLDEVKFKIDYNSLVIFILLILFFIILYIFRNKVSDSLLKGRIFVMLPYSFVFIISIVGLVFANNSVSSSEDKYLRSTFYNNAKYVNRFGVYDYIVNDTTSLFNNKGQLDAIEIDSISNFIQENDITIHNEFSNVYKDKNLILIECESLNNYPFIEELTPTLVKLSKEGYYFTNFYSPLYESATSDAEFISLTSMLPSINEGQTCYTYSNNNYKYSLPNLFKQRGYNVNSYHSNYARFYNREVFHKALGFDEFYDLEKLGIKQLPNYVEDTNWIPDTMLFDSLLDHTDVDSQFFDFVTTVSGHMPYVDYREEIKDNLAIINSTDKYNYMNNETKAYVACQMSLDQGLEILLNKLEEKNILDKTIIILFGDHYPYGLEDLDAQYTVYGTGIEKYKTPLIIYDPSNIEGKTVDTLVSSFDIYPTICNMFGLNSTGAYKIGKDVFEDDHLVIFSNRSFLTSDYYYDSTNENVEWYSSENQNELEGKKKIVKDIFENGEKILIFDYYNN